MHLFKDLSHLAILSHQIHHYMETYPALWFSNYSQTSPQSLHILGIRSLCFKKHPRKEDPKLWKSGLFFPSRTEKWVAMEYESVRLLAVLTFKFMIYFNFSYNEHLKPQKYLRKHECLEKPKIWLPVKLHWWMKTFGRGDNFLFEDWYFKSSCANFSEELRWSMTYGDHMSRLVRDSPGLHLLSLPHY